MLDIKEIRNDPNRIESLLKSKDPNISLEEILSLDEQIRKQQTSLDALKAKRNRSSKEIGEKKRAGTDVSSVMKEMGSLSNEIAKLDTELNELEQKRDNLLAPLPNIPMKDIPVSLDPKENVSIKEHGEKRSFDFTIKNHVELNEKLQLFDFQKGAASSGAGWVYYTGLGAKLEWALLNYMLDIHKKNGFLQVMPPLLMKQEMMYGSGQLPKFESQLYKIQDKDYNLYLIPTAEVALNAMHYDEIIDEEQFPIRYVSYTPCFRREAGAAGSQERGLIRTHQFNKVEMFCLTLPEDSNEVFEKMLQSAEQVVEGLELHYRNMLLVTGDTSFASAKTVDLEVWLPGQNRYYEVSSISNCTDFQARRSQIRFRKKQEKPQFVHTLNGSGVATSRLMVAILENFQQEDGSIVLPKALKPYLGESMMHLKPPSSHVR